MERNIIIKHVNANKVKVIKSSAVTVADLKREIEQVGLSCDNLSLVEAISKTKLTSDDQQLPVSVLKADGTTTTDIIIVVTNTEKQIKSGMTRSELYAEFCNNEEARSKCVEKYGRGYSSVSSSDLEGILAEMRNNTPVNTASISVLDEINKSNCISSLCEVIAAASARINSLAMCKCKGENPLETTSISQDELDSYTSNY